MEPDQVRLVVKTTLAIIGRIARRTRSQADDLLAAMLQGNEGRIAQAVSALVAQPDPRPTDEQIAQALASVGIKV